MMTKATSSIFPPQTKAPPGVNYNQEREYNIIKNIAKEIVLECNQRGFEVSQELADYVVKLKMLNPKNGFTASEVMPRSITQQLVQSVIDDLKQDTPAMNCIRMQVFWNSSNLNVAELKREFLMLLEEKSEPYLTDILTVERDETNRLSKLLTSFILSSQNLGNVSNTVHVKETTAAIHSVFKNRDQAAFFSYGDEQKIEVARKLAFKITGIRLYLKMLGKAGEGVEDVKTLANVLETCKEYVTVMTSKITVRIEEIRDVVSSLVGMDGFVGEVVEPAEIYLPPEYDASDLKYLKQTLVIMLQHDLYLNDVASKLDEIDGNSHFYLKELEGTLFRLHETIRDREAVPTNEVYGDFIRAGELWKEIQCYFYCFDSVHTILEKLQEINKDEYFARTSLEKATSTPMRSIGDFERKSVDSAKTHFSSSALLKDSEDFHIEFRGFCAWTLFFGEGFLIPSVPQAGIFQHNDQYFSFATSVGHELWSKNPENYIRRIYENLRSSPELVELLSAYDNLYSIKSLQLVKKTDKKILTRTESIQTVVHPIEKHWDKYYTFSEWELKKQALALSRLIKCVTKSVQTVNHSHYRASIGLLAAPNKEKEVQTKKDNSCVHETISAYLYGLRGHYEDKFKHLTLTRPVDETCQREIIFEKPDCCRDRLKVKSPKRHVSVETCTSMSITNPCDFSDDCRSDFMYNYNGEA